MRVPLGRDQSLQKALLADLSRGGETVNPLPAGRYRNARRDRQHEPFAVPTEARMTFHTS
jgi:hypothetical protein